MVYVVPGVMVLWGSMFAVVRPHGKGAFWLAGLAGTAAMTGAWLLLVPGMGGIQAVAAAYGVLGLVLLGARRWATKAMQRKRPVRGRYPVRERRVVPRESETNEMEFSLDVPMAQSQAARLAARRAIRWKANP